MRFVITFFPENITKTISRTYLFWELLRKIQRTCNSFHENITFLRKMFRKQFPEQIVSGKKESPRYTGRYMTYICTVCTVQCTLHGLHSARNIIKGKIIIMMKMKRGGERASGIGLLSLYLYPLQEVLMIKRK